MTVKELRELLEGLKDDKEVIAEFNGKYLKVDSLENSYPTNEIIFKLSKED